MTIDSSFPQDTDFVNNFPAGHRAQATSLLVDHSSDGLHDKTTFNDLNGSTPSAPASGKVMVWQEAGQLKARLGSNSTQELGDFLASAASLVSSDDATEFTDTVTIDASSGFPLRIEADTGEARQLALVDANGDRWGYFGKNTSDNIVIASYNTPGGSEVAAVDFQQDGDINFWAGTPKVSNNEIIHAGNLGPSLAFSSGSLNPQRFESSAITITSFTSFTASTAHSLGARPWLISAAYRCKSVEGGYSVDDEIAVQTSQTVSDHADGATVWADSTSIGFALTATSNTNANHKDTGALFNLSTSSWDLILRAWR